MVLRPVPGSVTRHQLLVASVDHIIAPGPVQGAGPCVRESTLSPVTGEGGLDHLAAECLVVSHVSHVIAKL